MGLVALSLTALPRVPGAQAAFPGRNGRLAFAVLNQPAVNFVHWDTDIFTVTPGGSGIRQLTDGPEMDLWPSWSPDGRRLAFMRALNLSLPSDIYLMDAEGGGIEQLMATPDFSEWAPTWSPDGTKIAFVGGTEGGFVSEWHIYVMDADGSDPIELTEGPFHLTPAWSPDGKWIAFSQGGERRLVLVRPDGTRRELLPSCGPGTAYAPVWSPDASRLAFESVTYDSSGAPVAIEVWSINVDGTGCLKLIRSGGINQGPAWSPDGKGIAFVSDRGGSPALYKMRLDGSGVVKLVDLLLTPAGLRPDWGPRP